MKIGTIISVLLSLAFSSAIHAATYTSPDGNIGFDLPADGSLVEVKNPPGPATAMWEVKGGGRLIFLTQPDPQNHLLALSALEEGTRTSFPGSTLLPSSETTENGVPVFTISAVTKTGGHIQQTILVFNKTLYKLMAVGPKSISSDPHFSVSFQSLKILDPEPNSPRKKFSGPDMGAKFAVLILFIAGVVWVIRKIVT